jgi:hypothetical protein
LARTAVDAIAVAAGLGTAERCKFFIMLESFSANARLTNFALV